ncbi:MAG: TIGR00730 family Rossman fold protein [Dehalococcoidia bacterium]
MQAICVFCGSRAGDRATFETSARLVGETIAQRGLTLVYGGGRVGLMGVVADAALAAGGRVIGVIPEPLAAKEIAHSGLTELHLVRSMHERKALMGELSDGFVTLPGGFGTLEEFFEVLTWGQLGIHRKPCGLLNVDRYFDPLVAFFDRALNDGFITAEHRRLVLQAATPSALLGLMDRYVPPAGANWVTVEEM